jgi:hypothetical protein
MPNEDGILIDVNKGQRGNKRRANDRTKVTDAKMTVSKISADVTEFVITMRLSNCKIVNIDPLVTGNVSEDQVFLKTVGGELLLEDKHSGGIFTRLTNKPNKLNQMSMQIDLKGGGGKIGGPGLDSLKKATKKKAAPKKRKK